MKIAVFSPFSSIWTHATLEASVAEHLRSFGHDVQLVFCGGLLTSHCSAMSESGLEQVVPPGNLRERVCHNCIRRASGLATDTGLDSTYLSNWLSKTELEEVEKQIACANMENWQSFEIDGVPLGRYASYEFALANKISDSNFDLKLFPYYLNQLRNTVRTYRAWKTLITDSPPDVLIVANDLYSINRAASSVCHKAGIRTLTLGNGTDLRRYGNSITLSENAEVDLLANRHEGLEYYKTKDISQASIEQVGEHFAELAMGRSPFSYTPRAGKLKPDAVRRKLGVTKDAKIAIVLLSSQDERMAADLVGIRKQPIQSSGSSLFESQFSWVSWIIRNAPLLPEIVFVIRLHPRLFPNKREGMLSQAALEYERLLVDLPANVLVDWPHKNLSLYDLAGIAACVLNHTSSAGLEMLALGLPVVQHDPEGLFAYPSSLNVSPKSTHEYVKAISSAVNSGHQTRNIIEAYRWKSWQFSIHSRNLNNGFPRRIRWNTLRLLNGIYLRKGIAVPDPILRFFEKREFSRRRLDEPVAQDLNLLVSSQLRSFADIPFEAELPANSSSNNEDIIIRRQVRTIRRIYPFYRRKNNQIVSWVRNLSDAGLRI
jgi:hypothetical protein